MQVLVENNDLTHIFLIPVSN